MKDLAKFATEEHPLHPSGLLPLVLCPWRMVMRYFEEPSEEHGVAGDTGSATHVAVAEFHRGKDLADCLAAIGANQARYPRADLTDAAGMFLEYAKDDRNTAAKVVAIEQAIRFQISPADEDKTGAPIQVIGTFDQVREVNGELKLYDLKTSKRQPMALLHHHVLQIAAYCVGATVFFGKPVHPGALILTRQYRGKVPSTAPAFWHYNWRLEDTARILAVVRSTVARIRAGDVWHLPSDDMCTWCEMKTPDVCLPKLKELVVL